MFISKIISTHPIPDQKTGTSGLRRKVALVQSVPLYIENWLQSLVNSLGSEPIDTLVLGGDGRYLNDVAAISAIEILAANGVGRLIVGTNVLLSTPACSALIRARNAFGGIIMTASHNPAGPSGDWGIKFNAHNGEPAPEKLTNLIYEETKKINSIKRVDLQISVLDLSKVSVREFIVDGKKFILEIVDPVETYLLLLKTIFDFSKLKAFCSSKNLLFDGMHAVTGVYASRIFCDELGLPASCLQNCVPSPTFNGGHPDPNLVYAHDLVERMHKEPILLGAASDGDGDRNMIMGASWFVTPSDSLAIIANYATRAIPYFAKNGLKGVARSMPTSRAIDLVCERLEIPCYETPTGWKFFGNLMDAGLVNLCGEESFGTGAAHIREKDGIWAVLAWLSILEFENGRSVADINKKHWETYGRHMYARCDYDEVEQSAGDAVMDYLRTFTMGDSPVIFDNEYVVESVKEFAYTDPVDGSISNKQGIVVCFTNKSRIMYRLSGTGSAGATVRIYVERYTRNVNDGLESLVKIAKDISKIKDFTGRSEPSLVT